MRFSSHQREDTVTELSEFSAHSHEVLRRIRGSLPSERAKLDSEHGMRHRIFLNVNQAYHTFTAEVTNAHFHVDEDETCPVTQCIGEVHLCAMAIVQTIVWPETPLAHAG